MARKRETGAGRTTWAFALPGIPVLGHGPEPAFTSRDTLSVINPNNAIAHVRLLVHYPWKGTAGPFRLTVAPHRLRRVRINDLIFPEAVRLATPYGLRLTSDHPVVAQVTGGYSDASRHARTWALAYPASGQGM